MLAGLSRGETFGGGAALVRSIGVPVSPRVVILGLVLVSFLFGCSAGCLIFVVLGVAASSSKHTPTRNTQHATRNLIEQNRTWD
jgi:uncharacterized membrane protein